MMRLNNLLESIIALIANISDILMDVFFKIKKLARRYKNKTIREFKKDPIGYVFSAISIAILLWMFISFIDVNLSNIPGSENYGRHINHGWNFWNIFCDFIKKVYPNL